MMWVRDRIKEPTTRIGILALLALVTTLVEHPPESLGDFFRVVMLAVAGAANVMVKQENYSGPQRRRTDPGYVPPPGNDETRPSAS